MEFCNICNNMLYIKVVEEQLKNYCKNCNFSEDIKSDVSKMIIENNYEENTDTFDDTMNSNIKYDPTLPRVNNIKCPNKECTKKNNQQDEVIYTKYDKNNLKFKYYCVYCEHFWNN